MKTGLCTIAFKELALKTVLDLASRCGFDGVEPWGRPDHTPPAYDQAHNLRVAEAVRARGLEVSQFGSYANPTSDEFQTEMGDALKIARDLGTDRIRVWAGRTGSADADAAQWETVISSFRRSCDQALSLGIALVVEMHENRLTDTAEGSLRLVEGVGRPNFLLNFQPMSSHGPDRVLEEVRKVAPLVSAVHAQNRLREGGRGLISEGIVDYAAVVSELRKAGFDGYIEVEFVREECPEEALAADARFLRSLCRM